MIKKILTVLFFFYFLNNVVIASQKIPKWVYVGQNSKDSKIYIDVNNIISKSKNTKQYWTKINMEKPSQLGGKNYYSILAFSDVKCDEQTVSKNFIKFYKDYDNRGDTTPDFGKPNHWVMIIPGSIESEMVFKYVCK
jgi:hypothetical protein